MATAPLVDWPMPPARTIEPGTDLQLYAIAIGASVPAILASAAWWLHLEWIAVIAAVGMFVGPVLAVEGAGRMLGRSWWVGALRAGFLAPLAVATLILVLVAVYGVVAILTMSIDGLFFTFVFGFMVVAVAMAVGLPITLPTALVVAWLLRRAAAMDQREARLHVGALAAGAALAGAITLAAVQAGGGLLSGGWTG
jgi:hypothetical protein